jgi:hypothetical protein
MRGAIPPLTHTSSWRDTYAQGQLYLTFTLHTFVQKTITPQNIVLPNDASLIHIFFRIVFRKVVKSLIYFFKPKNPVSSPLFFFARL